MRKIALLLVIATISLSYSCSSSTDKEGEKKNQPEKEIKNETKEGEIYSKTFGESGNPAVIFLHGGPGYNSANFEGSTAQALADKGFYVIVYDRRGEGRSLDKNAAFTYDQTNEDLNGIFAKYKLDSAILVGHSYGGVVATLFTEKYPEKVTAIVLVGAPVSLQETFRTIISTCKKIYTDKNDKENLRYIGMLETMDTTTMDYASYCFGHAMQNGFYYPKNPTENARSVYETLGKDSVLTKLAMKMTPEAPAGFQKNENYTCVNLASPIKNIIANGKPVYGLYGNEDGLYSPAQITKLEKMIGKDHVLYMRNCSHNVFIDQQTAFLDAFVNWFKK